MISLDILWGETKIPWHLERVLWLWDASQYEYGLWNHEHLNSHASNTIHYPYHPGLAINFSQSSDFICKIKIIILNSLENRSYWLRSSMKSISQALGMKKQLKTCIWNGLMLVKWEEILLQKHGISTYFNYILPIMLLLRLIPLLTMSSKYWITFLIDRSLWLLLFSF